MFPILAILLHVVMLIESTRYRYGQSKPAKQSDCGRVTGISQGVRQRGSELL